MCARKAQRWDSMCRSAAMEREGASTSDKTWTHGHSSGDEGWPLPQRGLQARGAPAVRDNHRKSGSNNNNNKRQHL